jgi:predicted Zn-ribbon and HTH transcriptional regulator
MAEKLFYNGKETTIRELGEDYIVVYEYTCMECDYKWRMTMLSKNQQCPKCRSIKLYYVSKRSCDEEVSEEVSIPKDSELL